MNWKIYVKGFKDYLRLEKALSANSVEAYVRDVEKLQRYFSEKEISISEIDHHQLTGFLADLKLLEINPRSRARITSGIKAFFKYLMLEKIISADPSERFCAGRVRAPGSRAATARAAGAAPGGPPRAPP